MEKFQRLSTTLTRRHCDEKFIWLLNRCVDPHEYTAEIDVCFAFYLVIDVVVVVVVDDGNSQFMSSSSFIYAIDVCVIYPHINYLHFIEIKVALFNWRC